MSATVREWARANGYTVAERGRLAPEVHRAYREAHPEEERAARPTNAAKCPACGRVWTASSEVHCPNCHRHFTSIRYFDDHMQGPDGQHERAWCRDPETIPTSRKDPTPKLKVKETAWGPVYASAAERPDDVFNGEPTLL
jgi:hypothetical protein